ncbi:beta-N-acetylglucosaminidase domain-containing protein [Buchananella felis]|uniref:beta-N-acetylglucosaminidase domain-containing protein n=1 Tax=Buchananella felis TaxID=3231492 RepID=UPI0035281400
MPIQRKPVALLAAMAAAFSALVSPAFLATPALADETLPEVFPAPISMTANTTSVALKGAVTIVAPADADAPTIRVLREIVQAAGGTATVAQAMPTSGTAILLSLDGTGTDVTAALAAASVEGPASLKAEGYVLATTTYQNVPTVVLAGKDADGAFYGAQTLRQLVVDGNVAGAAVRDNPLMSIRGTIEGFYGIPWSHQARLDLIEFSGKNKMNTFIYSPKDDQLARHQWKTLYPADELNRMGELIERANANHVDFTYVISPGNTICYSRQADYDQVVAKFEQIRSKGGHSFYVALDDINPRLNCQEDREKYGNIPNWGFLAVAQAEFLNKLQTEYIEPNNLDDLQTVPTNYNGSREDPYKRQFGEKLNDKVRVQWTGEGVFSDTITDASVQAAVRSYRTNRLYIWDNFPVNDGQRNRLFLNPLDGRSPNLYKYIEGFTANPMIQPYASLISLAGYADYTWNPPAYNPQKTYKRILDELAGPDPQVRKALEVFADVNQSWRPYRPNSPLAPQFTADLQSFRAGNKQPLLDRLQVLSELPEVLAQMDNKGFVTDAQGWIESAAWWAASLGNLIAANDAVKAGTGEAVATGVTAGVVYHDLTLQPTVDDMREDSVLQKAVIVPSVGDTRFDELKAELFPPLDAWLGATPMPGAAAYSAQPSTNMGQYSNNSPAKAVDGNPDTLWWSNTAGDTGRYFQLDLGSVKTIGSIKLQQSDNDTATSGDMIYSGVIEVSATGDSWKQVGTVSNQPVVHLQLATPEEARFVRLRATSNNPGGKWVKIREFQVAGTVTSFSTTFEAASGTVLSVADGKLETGFMAPVTQDKGTITRQIQAGTTPKFATVVGMGKGKIEAQVAGEWAQIGTIDSDESLHEAAIPAGATAVRLDFTGPDPVMVQEFALRTGPALDGTTPPTPEPTQSATPEPTQSATPEPTQSATPEPTQSATPEPTQSATPEPTQSATPEPTQSATPEPTQSATPAPQPPMKRFEGTDRIDTALKIAGDKATTVVLANAWAPADGLVATPLADALDAPLLLTGRELDPRVERWLADAKVERVVVMGQTGSISAAAENKLVGMGIVVDRVGGPTRYATSVLAAAEMERATGEVAMRAFVVNGESMADALAAGPVAAKEDLPILLVANSAHSQASVNYLRQNGIAALAVGGGAARDLQAVGVRPAVVVAGTDRYDTAASLATRFMPSAQLVGIANGSSLVDALAGGVDVAKDQGVLLFTRSNTVPGTTADFVKASGAKAIRLYGGTTSLDTNVQQELERLVK